MIIVHNMPKALHRQDHLNHQYEPSLEQKHVSDERTSNHFDRITLRS